MDERKMVLEDLQEELETIDAGIWDLIMRVDSIYADDFRISDQITKIASRLDEVREANEMFLSEVVMELEQYEPRDLFDWRDE
jgi:archaellum component FlaC